MNQNFVTSENVSRRNFSAFAAAAVGGLLASRRSAWAAEEKKPEIFVDPSLLMTSEKNVCRGLNACKGHGKGNHECAGFGSCATVDAHTCAGSNECKGQGGCGGYPGQNTCKEKGHCAVPLKDDTWEIARKQFEHLMKDTGKNVGKAPDPSAPRGSGNMRDEKRR